MAILETHDIGKRYGRRRPWALRHLDLSVPVGSVTALVGPNGSGKSTLLKAWIGFERPTEGHLTRRRHRPVEGPRRRRSGGSATSRRPVALPRTDRRRARRPGGDAAPGLRPRHRAPAARRPRDPAHSRADELSGDSRRRSGWRSRWGRGRRSCCSTSRSRASIRSRGASSSTSWSTRSVRTARRRCCRRTSSPTSSRPATGCSSSAAGGCCWTSRSPARSRSIA